MKCFNDTHPHLRSPPGCMSQQEILYWFKELYTNPELGWTHSKKLLARTIGFHNGNGLAHLKVKIDGRSFLYPGEQIRFSRNLKRIISGELICVKVGKYYQAVPAEHPRPLKGSTRLRYNLAGGRLHWVTPPLGRAPTLPSFKKLFANAPLGESMKG